MPTEIKKSYSMYRLFSYKDIENKFENYYQTWIANKEILEPIYNLYFGIIYNRHMYLEQKFLGLIQAVESFHRRTSDQIEMSEVEHQSRINSILNSVPSEYKNWLERELLYSNELSLRKRLDILLGQFPEVIKNYSLSKDQFVDLVVNTRNYLTHYDKSLKTKAANFEQQQELYNRLMLLVEACLLSKLGFNPNKITFLIEKSMISKGI